ncbi:ATP-dependent DNA helicase RecQ [Jejudonia soesokkakensis]|uniref:ATP-dependent DNA helicase RecQ n=1 Tax=Jejudonia soesokkakensis TaxID=1323432 RepID=A0ABW2MQ82_9FLAO
MKTPLQILEEFWRYSAFKPRQEEIIEAVLDGRDTVALLPTGGGKSICFQVPAVLQPGICIVISPLVALMTDQVGVLKEKGIKALAITGGISFEELRTLLDNAIHGNYKFLYLSPERLQQEVVQNAIRQMPVNLIAVDEAHCISQWGNDFRPAYKNIVLVRQLHPLVPIIALTATATPEVLEDTINELNLEVPAIFKNSFTRENLAYKVYQADDKLYYVEQFLKNNAGSAIVYVRNRKATIEYSDQLNAIGISSTFYHGGISKKDKDSQLEQWKNGTISTIVATNAFGMGIDNPNVRFVIHIQLPESLESYFQEAGRAGRDGNYAQAIVLYNEYDKVLAHKQFVKSLASVEDLKHIYRKLNNYFQISYGEGVFTEHSFGFSEFCEQYQLNTLITFNGLTTLDRLGVLQLSKQFGRKSQVQFLIPSEKLLTYFEKDPTASVIGKSLLRIYGGIFEISTAVNLDYLAKKTGQSLHTIIEVLRKMERDEIIELSLRITDATITFLVPREDDKTIHVIAKDVNELNAKKEAQLDSVLTYITNEKKCRSLQLVSYFGEENEVACGICSVCASQNTSVSKKELQLISEKIKILLEEAPLTSRELVEKGTFTEAKILKVLQLLLDADQIGINTKNQYYLV